MRGSTHEDLVHQQPWEQRPLYFKSAELGPLATVRLANHAAAGRPAEVMGVLTGRIADNTFVVHDCFPLPVEATETRVNAMGEAYEFMVRCLEAHHQLGNKDNIVGWYHSHPGYRCWLSRIDVGTQQLNQRHQDPFIAIVVDPDHTQHTGRLDLGAFRTLAAHEKDKVTLSARQSRTRGSAKDSYYALEVVHQRPAYATGLCELLWTCKWESVLAETQSVGCGDEETVQRLEDLAHQQATLVNGERRPSNDFGVGGLAPPLARLASRHAGQLLQRRLRVHNPKRTPKAESGSAARRMHDALRAQVSCTWAAQPAEMQGAHEWHHEPALLQVDNPDLRTEEMSVDSDASFGSLHGSSSDHAASQSDSEMSEQ